VLFISCVVPVPNVTLWCYTDTKNIADSPSLRVSGPSRPRPVAPPPYSLGVGLSFKSAQNKNPLKSGAENLFPLELSGAFPFNFSFTRSMRSGLFSGYIFNAVSSV
jgi:hypothetical protein